MVKASVLWVGGRKVLDLRLGLKTKPSLTLSTRRVTGDPLSENVQIRPQSVRDCLKSSAERLISSASVWKCPRADNRGYLLGRLWCGMLKYVLFGHSRMYRGLFWTPADISRNNADEFGFSRGRTRIGLDRSRNSTRTAAESGWKGLKINHHIKICDKFK